VLSDLHCVSRVSFALCFLREIYFFFLRRQKEKVAKRKRRIFFNGSAEKKWALRWYRSSLLIDMALVFYLCRNSILIIASYLAFGSVVEFC